MALTRTDENELLTALHEGPHEAPRWRTFLDRLRRRTRADHAALIFGHGDAPGPHAPIGLDPAYARLRPGRVYSAEELGDPADQAARGRGAPWPTDARDRARRRQRLDDPVAREGGFRRGGRGCARRARAASGDRAAHPRDIGARAVPRRDGGGGARSHRHGLAARSIATAICPGRAPRRA